MKRVTAFALIAMLATPVMAQPVQYDQQQAITNRRAEIADGRTRFCMDNAARAELQQGVRDRKTITRFMAMTCRKLIEITMQGHPAREIGNALLAMAGEELDSVLAEGR